MKIVKCPVCENEYSKDDRWRRRVCRSCYRKLENERARIKRAGSYYTRSDMHCHLCGHKLTAENKVAGMRRCKHCHNEIKSQQRASRERMAEIAERLKRERMAPEPMGIPIYNPWW